MLSTVVAGCTRPGQSFSAGPEGPSRTAVADGRFVTTIEMGQGTLLVTPPPDGARGTFPESKAWTILRTADVAYGTYRFAIIGLGLASLLPGASPEGPTSSTTSVPASTPSGPGGRGVSSSSSAPTTTVPPTTTTVPRTTTTVPATTSSVPPSNSTVPPTSSTTAPPPSLPSYVRRLAYVGIAFGGPACPTDAQKPGGAAGGTSTQVAVLIDATNGHDVLAFTGDAGFSCSAPPSTPTVVRPNQLLSVPWQPVGPASTAVQATLPACGHYVGWTEAPGPTSQSAIEVVASVPFDPLCGASAPQLLTVDDVIPLGSSQQQVPHASLGPVQGLRVLPGGTVGLSSSSRAQRAQTAVAG